MEETKSGVSFGTPNSSPGRLSGRAQRMKNKKFQNKSTPSPIPSVDNFPNHNSESNTAATSTVVSTADTISVTPTQEPPSPKHPEPPVRVKWIIMYKSRILIYFCCSLSPKRFYKKLKY